MLRAFADLHARPSWSERCEELVAYRRVHGDCNVPKAHGPLGRWVARQRELAKKHVLPRDRRERLDELGFVWNTNDAAWAARYAALQEWARVNGHACVPIASGDLGLWVAKQRQLRRKGKLAEERLAALDALSFVWDTAAAEWEEKFACLLEWKAAHDGDTRVPFNSPAGDGLGWWVATQRQVRRKGKMSPERQRRLDEIGFVWNPTEVPRQRHFSNGNPDLASAALGRTRSAHVGTVSSTYAAFPSSSPQPAGPSSEAPPRLVPQQQNNNQSHHHQHHRSHQDRLRLRYPRRLSRERDSRHQQNQHQPPLHTLYRDSLVMGAPPARGGDSLFRTRSAHVPASRHADFNSNGPYDQPAPAPGPRIDPTSFLSRTRSAHGGAFSLGHFRGRSSRRGANAQARVRATRVPDPDPSDTLRRTRSAHVDGGASVLAPRHRSPRVFPTAGVGVASSLGEGSVGSDLAVGGASSARSPTPPRSASPASGASLPGMRAPRRSSGSKRSYDEAAASSGPPGSPFAGPFADSAMAPPPESKRHHSFSREPSSAGPVFPPFSAKADYAASEAITDWGQLPSRRTASFSRFSPRASTSTPPGSVDALALPPLSAGSGTSTPNGSGSVRMLSGPGFSPSSSPHAGPVMLAPLVVPGEERGAQTNHQLNAPARRGPSTLSSAASIPSSSASGSTPGPPPLLPPVSSLATGPTSCGPPDGCVGQSSLPWPQSGVARSAEYDWHGEQDEYSGAGPRRIAPSEVVSQERMASTELENLRGQGPSGTSWASKQRPSSGATREMESSYQGGSREGSEASAIANLAQLAVSGRGSDVDEGLSSSQKSVGLEDGPNSRR